MVKAALDGNRGSIKKTENVLEESIVKAIMRWLKALPECEVRKTYGDAKRKGEADISGCLSGRRFEIEVKRPGKDASELQKAVLSKWARAGALTGVAHSLDEAKAILSVQDKKIAFQLRKVQTNDHVTA